MTILEFKAQNCDKNGLPTEGTVLVSFFLKRADSSHILFEGKKVEFQELSELYPGITFVKIDIDDEKDKLSYINYPIQQINNLPEFILFENGQAQAEYCTYFASKEKLEEFINTNHKNKYRMLYNIDINIQFVNRGDSGGIPEPYGEIIASVKSVDDGYSTGAVMDANNSRSVPSIDNYLSANSKHIVWKQKNLGNSTPSVSSTDVCISSLINKPTSITFYGEVKEYDSGNGDDILSYPESEASGPPNTALILSGEDSGSYVEIRYSIKEVKFISRFI